MKLTCTKCGHQGDATEDFPPNKATWSGRSSWCRECHREASRQWRKRNPGRSGAASLEANRARRFKNRVKLQIEKQARGCEKCGALLVPHRQLHFHHPNGRPEGMPVPSKLVNRAWATIKAEIDKCVVLCDHCHGQHHYKSIAA